MNINKLISQSMAKEDVISEEWLSDLSDKVKETVKKGVRYIKGEEPSWFDKTKEGLRKSIKYIKKEPGKAALATGAALAAGLGALALAKKMRQSKKGTRDRSAELVPPAKEYTQTDINR